MIRDKLELVRVDSIPFILDYPYKNRTVRKYAYAHQSDFIRLDRLLERGGIYADLDTIFVNPIPARLYQESFVLGREGDVWNETSRQFSPSLCNAFIMSKPNAPFGRLWRELMPVHFDGSWSHHSTILPYQLAQAHPDLLHIEPPRTFYKHPWTREGLHTLLEDCDTDNEGVVSMHLWSHLWWSRWRRDFSGFHAGRLTEDYILKVDTTYNLVARRYLPPS
ncbi:MAG TPA: glycosyltransferase [Anaerolineae bacterium]